MIEDKQVVKIISLINKMTKDNEIIWTIKKGAYHISLDADEALIGYSYETSFKQQQLRLFKFSYREYTDYDEYVTSSTIRLSFIDYLGNSLWDFPRERTIGDLYETVRYKTANVEDFLNSLNLEDEPTDENLPLF